jgi:predicted nucleic acid-binding protein
VARVQAAPVSGYLVDTSAVIAGEWPSTGDLEISVITLGELRTGIFTAADPVTRAQRNRQFAGTLKTFLAHDVDSRVAERFGEIQALARLEGRVKNNADLLIIATAAEHALTLFTRDEKQGKLAEDLGLLVEYAS